MTTTTQAQRYANKLNGMRGLSAMRARSAKSVERNAEHGLMRPQVTYHHEIPRMMEGLERALLRARARKALNAYKRSLEQSKPELTLFDQCIMLGKQLGWRGSERVKYWQPKD